MTKILFTVTNDLSYDQRMDRICSALVDAGFEVTLVGRKKRDSKELVNKKYQQYRLSCYFEKGKLFYLEFNIRLFFHLLLAKMDIISSVDLDTILPGYLISRWRSKRFVYDSHEYFTEVIEVVQRPKVKRIWEAVEAFVLPKIKYAYTVSESLQKEFEKKYFIKFEVIRNVPFLEEKTGSDDNEKVLIYIGAVNKGRGLELLLEVVKELNYNLWICGKGDIYDDLVLKTKSLGIEKCVTFYGYLNPEELRRVTRQAYVGYLLLEKESLSYYYSLANKFFDYIHAGIPQLVINFPEYQIINQQYQVALLTELTKDSIKENLQKLWQDLELYQHLKNNTYKAKLEYNWQTESKKLIELYKTVEEGGEYGK
jgi:glycosyltransferase involved in cell wall biosynthesis